MRIILIPKPIIKLRTNLIICTDQNFLSMLNSTNELISLPLSYLTNLQNISIKMKRFNLESVMFKLSTGCDCNLSFIDSSFNLVIRDVTFYNLILIQGNTSKGLA